MAPPQDSVLNTTKKLLGFDPDYTAFDVDIMIHINSAFSTLAQLGVGQKDAEFEIEGPDETWTDFMGVMPGINSVRTYVYLSVRLIFDPPATSYAQDAMKERAKELEWRLNVAAEKFYRPQTVAPED